jgi:hypothetical protein
MRRREKEEQNWSMVFSCDAEEEREHPRALMFVQRVRVPDICALARQSRECAKTEVN